MNSSQAKVRIIYWLLKYCKSFSVNKNDALFSCFNERKKWFRQFHTSVCWLLIWYWWLKRRISKWVFLLSIPEIRVISFTYNRLATLSLFLPLSTILLTWSLTAYFIVLIPFIHFFCLYIYRLSDRPATTSTSTMTFTRMKLALAINCFTF